MDTITLARELGRAIQQEESYINLKNVQAQADADAELQKLIGEFNTKRMGINEEASKKDRDQQKLTTLNRTRSQTALPLSFSSASTALTPRSRTMPSPAAEAAAPAAAAADKL